MVSRWFMHITSIGHFKETAFNAADPGSIPGLGRSPGEGNIFLPGKSHKERSLVDYSPWGCKESDTNEQLTLSLHFYYCYISSTSDHQALHPRDYGPCSRVQQIVKCNLFSWSVSLTDLNCHHLPTLHLRSLKCPRKSPPPHYSRQFTPAHSLP